jgi:phosphoribosylpyrophosphate synthetase
MVGSVATNDLMVFTGNANPELAKKIVQYLDIPLGIASVTEFSDGEISVEIGENVRGRGNSLLRICAAGPQGTFATGADYGQGGG